jgi:hypothetical protein
MEPCVDFGKFVLHLLYYMKYHNDNLEIPPDQKDFSAIYCSPRLLYTCYTSWFAYQKCNAKGRECYTAAGFARKMGSAVKTDTLKDFYEVVKLSRTVAGKTVNKTAYRILLDRCDITDVSYDLFRKGSFGLVELGTTYDSNPSSNGSDAQHRLESPKLWFENDPDVFFANTL